MASMNYFLNISLRDDFRIGVVISPWVAVLAFVAMIIHKLPPRYYLVIIVI
jgi:hypothetical protein